MTKQTFKQLFPKEIAAREQGFCPFCKEPISMDGFKDQLSRREYEISGLCQKCQDKIFEVE